MLMAETGKARRAWGIGLMYKNSGPMPHDKARKDAPCRDGVTTQQAARMGRMAPPRGETCTVPASRTRDTFTPFGGELESPQRHILGEKTMS